MSHDDAFVLLGSSSAFPWGIVAVGFGVLVVLGWIAGLYNALVRRRNHVDESWADVDTELKRRHDLIPNLVETVKGYATHEQATFQKVVEARTAAASEHRGPADQARDENALTGALGRLFAVAEGYPDLKANTSFLELQRELSHTEDRIQRARRFYNANVRDLNNRVEVFPSNVIASIFGFRRREYFEIRDPAERKAPQVEL